MKFSMESENKFTDAMKSVRKSVKELKKLADDAGADIENYSLEFKLYLESKENNDLQISTSEKRKNFFEDKSVKDKIIK